MVGPGSFSPVARPFFRAQYKYCPQCGSAALRACIPEGDNRCREICDDCSYIHYRNPRIVAGCVAAWEDRVLLCLRAIEPRAGAWTLPAGFMENDESISEAAQRETLEEAKVHVELQGLFSLLSVPHADQVHAIFRARLFAPSCSPGVESRAARLFEEHELPWGKIAFSSIYHTLKLYFADRAAGRFQLHVGDILKQESAYILREHFPLPS